MKARFRNARRFGLSLAVLGLLLACPTAPAEEPESWTRNDDMLKFFQAASRIRDSHPTHPALGAITERSLTAYLTSLDPYSHYLDAAAYARFRESQQSTYAGVGMELSLTAEGRVFCVPYPDSPAASAGLEEGDELVAVNGASIQGLHLPELSPLIRGEPGTTVALELRREGTNALTLQVERRVFTAPSAIRADYNGIAWLRIFTFTQDTAAEVRRQLSDLGREEQVLIDLRRNPGGSVFGAIDTARLFLNTDAVIAILRTDQGEKTYATREPAVFPELQLFVIQDEHTASAAELFAAALAGNRRALTIGARTYGKGRTQQLVELMDGSALVLTDGEFLSPESFPIEGIGVEPHLPLRGGGRDLEAYVVALQLMLQAAPVTPEVPEAADPVPQP